MPSFNDRPAAISGSSRAVASANKNRYGGTIGYHSKFGRYFSTTTGRFMSRDKVLEQLDTFREKSADRTTALASQLRSGKITLKQFEIGMKTEIKSAHIAAAAVAAGGVENIKGKVKTQLNAAIKDQFSYLKAFIQSLKERGPEGMTGRDEVRAGMYGKANRGTYWATLRATHAQEAARRGMKPCERRVLGLAEHCQDCVEYADMGWQEEGELPQPTQDSQCGVNCKCTVEFKYIAEDADCDDPSAVAEDEVTDEELAGYFMDDATDDPGDET